MAFPFFHNHPSVARHHASAPRRGIRKKPRGEYPTGPTVVPCIQQQKHPSPWEVMGISMGITLWLCQNSYGK